VECVARVIRSKRIGGVLLLLALLSTCGMASDVVGTAGSSSAADAPVKSAIGAPVPATSRAPPPPGAGPNGDRVRSGTGFFISGNGLMLSATHVVEGCAQITVWPWDGPEWRASIVALSGTGDIALLSVHADVPRFASVDVHTAPRIGERVSTIGFGVSPTDPRDPVISQGSIKANSTDSPDNHLILIDARLLPGNSGGPVVDDEGKLLGMVTGRLSDREDLAVAVPIRDIGLFLLENRVKLPSAEVPGARPLGALLRGISVLVQCTSETSS